MNGSGEEYSEEAPFAVNSLLAAAHELKAPLALVRQLAFALETAEDPADRQRLIDRIALTSERALRLTTDLTKSARLDDGLFALEPLNPEQICRDIVAELSPLFTAHERTLRYKHRRSPQLLVGNRDLLRRIVTNFSDNALHYAAAGSDVMLQVRAIKSRGVVRIGVRDAGPALPADVWRSLHARSSRGPQAIQSRPQSSGLGLLLAHQFADAMQGTIGVTRHRDGATFYVELRASEQLSLFL
jgi:signal transduction histidine kinase